MQALALEVGAQPDRPQSLDEWLRKRGLAAPGETMGEDQRGALRRRKAAGQAQVILEGARQARFLVRLRPGCRERMRCTLARTSAR